MRFENHNFRYLLHGSESRFAFSQVVIMFRPRHLLSMLHGLVTKSLPSLGNVSCTEFTLSGFPGELMIVFIWTRSCPTFPFIMCQKALLSVFRHRVARLIWQDSGSGNVGLPFLRESNVSWSSLRLRVHQFIRKAHLPSAIDSVNCHGVYPSESVIDFNGTIFTHFRMY